MNRVGFRCHRARAPSCHREVTALFLARVALDAAREQFDRYALQTDEPEPGMVDAADLIDAAHAIMLRQRHSAEKCRPNNAARVVVKI